MSITFTGWVCIFCILMFAAIALGLWGYSRLRYYIQNNKDQAHLDTKAVATQVASLNHILAQILAKLP